MSKIRNLTKRPLVSIVTASYNSGRFIEECVRSILSQDYPYIEHIIQDGASTDKTLKVLKKYSTTQYKNRVKWTSKPDDGPVQAVNRALKKVKGDIILLLGADCILLPHACSWAVNNMIENPKAAVIYGDEYIIDKRGRTIKTFIPQQYNFAKLLCIELVPPADAAFIRRSAFEKVGFQLDKSLKNSADYELWVRLGLKFPLKYVKGFVCKFRWHSQSHSRSPQMLSNFVKEKKMVMDRIFESPKTSNLTRSLKKRAYTGLYFWAAQMQVDSGDNNDALKYLAKALLVNPSEEKLAKYVTYWKQTVVNQNLKVSFEEKNNPLISIVTPSYNSGRFIEDCIQSILAQDYPNIEHIIQDGGSTDQTKLVLRKYQKPQYQGRIKIFSEPDNGQSDALNRAIKKTGGEIILVLNADDMLMPYACSWGVEQMKNYPEYGVIYGDTYTVNEGGEIIDINKAHDYDFEKLLCVELVPPAQAAFIRRSALEKVGFWADATLDTCPDYEMWIRLAQKFSMKHALGVITKYRIYKNPQLDSKRPRMTKRFVAAKREVMDRLFNSPKTPSRIKKLRRRAYASLDLWASNVAFDMKDPRGGVYYMLRSFIRYPTIETYIYLNKTFRMFLYFAIIRVTKFLRTTH